MGEGESSTGRPVITAQRAPRRFQLASPVTALVLGLLVLALIIADVPLAALAHQGLRG